MKLAIVGGGMSGLVAAVTAVKAGAAVTVYEKEERVGRKILATGNGRCNLSNTEMTADHYHGDPSFVEEVYRQIRPQEVLEFWDDLGLILEAEEDRLYPKGRQASGVLDALRLEALRRGVNIRTSSPVKHLEKAGDRWRVTSGSGEAAEYDAVILAVGGKASPQLGSDGEIAGFAKELKHTLIPLRPALVRLSCQGGYFKMLAGCKITAGVTLTQNETVLGKEYGEVLFTKEGLSGPPVLNLAREALVPGRNCRISVHILRDMTESEAFLWLRERAQRFSYMTISEMLSGFLNKRLINPLVKEADVTLSTPCKKMTKRQIQTISHLLIDWSFPVSGSAGWKEAQVTVGGVYTEEVNSDTMESRRHKGLYIVGEALDVDGDCGGYNLHFAAATGILAAASAVKAGKDTVNG